MLFAARSRAIAAACLSAGLAASFRERRALAEDAPAATVHTATGADVTVSGYIEAYYQWNFDRPANRITNGRTFDSRHDTFTLQNAVLDTSFTRDAVSGRVALQVGHVGPTAYGAEPAVPATTNVGPSSASTWQYVQQAYLGYEAPLGAGLLVEAGLFLSPLGPESMAVKDQWNWSRSDLFAALPYYHAGARVSYPLTDALTLTLMACNGWNHVVDDNDEKSFDAELTYAVPDAVTAKLTYFGGVERANDAPERFGGPGSRGPWRHVVDAYVMVAATDALSFLVHGDGGFEVNAFGTSSWAGGAAYARAKLASWLYVALRVDRIGEKVAANARGTATPIFFPGDVRWVESGTATLDVRPTSNLSVRLEGRRDVASADLYFHGTIQGDGSASAPWVPSSTSQTTLTLGATAWF